MTANLDGVSRVFVLLDTYQLESSRNQAALWPLLTGLSTVGILSGLGAVFANRLIARIEGLQKQVESIASGDFQQRIHDQTEDELGQLANSVNSMAGQLQGLWKVMHRQQKVSMLHQLSGGLAHQLRNTLTGARLAIELHSRNCAATSAADDNELTIAIHQIENAEATIRRLVDVGLGRRQGDRAATLAECLEHVRLNVAPVAKHLERELHIETNIDLRGYRIADADAFIESITNLLLNAVDAGKTIRLTTEISPQQELVVHVIDNGMGPPESIKASIFEPFVTTRPEGLGLGLTQVKLAVEHLQGRISWRRSDGHTIFEIVVPVQRSVETEQ